MKSICQNKEQRNVRVRFLLWPSSRPTLNRAQCVSICILVAIFYVSIDMYANNSVYICMRVCGNKHVSHSVRVCDMEMSNSIALRWCVCVCCSWPEHNLVHVHHENNVTRERERELSVIFNFFLQIQRRNVAHTRRRIGNFPNRFSLTFWHERVFDLSGTDTIEGIQFFGSHMS